MKDGACQVKPEKHDIKDADTVFYLIVHHLEDFHANK